MKESYTKFEGPEKKLEIILSAPQRGLRSNADGRWNRVVQASRAEIISQISVDHLDAYLLSESSLFVWDDRILMITCGKTILIDAVPEILEIMNKHRVAMVFYERKNLLYPDEQPSNFEDDVARMLNFFPGKSYRLGPANHDHVHVFYSSHAAEASYQDATLQVLMHDLDASRMEIFDSEYSGTAAQVEKVSGLDRLYPDMVTDSYLFSPYGFSLNGICGPQYFTVHVTPQPDGSYASFETNVLEEDYVRVINKIISIFRPGRFSVLLTTSMDAQCLPSHSTVVNVAADYRVTEKSLYEFDCGYAATFLNYSIKHAL